MSSVGTGRVAPWTAVGGGAGAGAVVAATVALRPTEPHQTAGSVVVPGYAAAQLLLLERGTPLLALGGAPYWALVSALTAAQWRALCPSAPLWAPMLVAEAGIDATAAPAATAAALVVGGAGGAGGADRAPE